MLLWGAIERRILRRRRMVALEGKAKTRALLDFLGHAKRV